MCLRLVQRDPENPHTDHTGNTTGAHPPATTAKSLALSVTVTNHALLADPGLRRGSFAPQAPHWWAPLSLVVDRFPRRARKALPGLGE